MTPERFLAMLDAYGAELQRWPAAERDAARTLAAEGPLELRERFREAAALDELLEADRVAGPDARLMQRVIDSAAPIKLAARGNAPWWNQWLWPAGFAGAGLAGSVAGAVLVSVALRSGTPQRAIDWPERGTAFSELSSDWSEE